MKTIGIREDAYGKLFLVRNKLERERLKRVSFDTVINELISECFPEMEQPQSE